MATFVHLTTARAARGIERSGIAARSHGRAVEPRSQGRVGEARGHGRAGERGVYCMPMLPSFVLTHQWTRELRRWKPGVLVAVHLRLPDDQPVTVGHYGAAPEWVSAAEAAGRIAALDDPRGYEVFVPRAVTAAEVRRIRDVPQGTGWRYVPGAHGRRPCGCPVCAVRGAYKGAGIRRRYAEL